MYYHNITIDDMLNGEGLRTVLWVSGCSLNCPKCQNPQTHDRFSGIEFDESAFNEFMEKAGKDYISGITLTGGHPLEAYNSKTVQDIISKFKQRYPNKTVWLYTGLTWEEILSNTNSGSMLDIINLCDVIVDGRYVDGLRDVALWYRGSSNQRVIDVKKSINQGKVVLWCE